MSFKILVADKISAEGLSWLETRPGFDTIFMAEQDENQLVGSIGDFDAVIVRSATRITARVLEAANKLKVVGRAGIGVDNIDISEATEKGVVVLNTPDANATTTAELTIAHLLSLSRHLPGADRSVREGKWERAAFLGTEIAGKTLGILGYGTIGRLVAARGLGLQMNVEVYDPFVTDEVVRKNGCLPVDLETLLAKADYLSLHCPVTDETLGIIGKVQLAAMKRGARLINCARGPLVDEEALAAALGSGHLGGAALDVFASEPPIGSPLLEFPNVVFTPHLGASTREAQMAVGTQIARQVAHFLETGEPVNAINLPSVSADQLAKVRPWQGLGRSLGRLIGALADGPLDRIEVTLHGCPEDIDTHLVAIEAVVGLLDNRFSGPVNQVNALTLARRQGVKVVEARSDQVSDYRTRLDVAGSGAGGTTRVSGTLFDERLPRLVRIQDFDIEAVLEGDLLLTRHGDRPGVTADFCRVIADAGINITRLHLGPVGQEGRAMAVIGLEHPLSAEDLEKMRSLPALEAVYQLSCDGCGP
jgi:D-3-phosphoglycerate dehydrogenase